VVFEEREDQVYEGLLRCRIAQHLYPIVRSIPRILPAAFDQEADFGARYRDIISQYGVTVAPNDLTVLQNGTAKSFGYEWTTYHIQRPEEDDAYFRSKTGTDPASMSGKLVLDAGCGSGRYTRIAGEAGATVISVDISAAVETAAYVTAHLQNVHIIQADIFALPFASSTFDFIYSIGVLHHTPNTKQAFDKLVP